MKSNAWKKYDENQMKLVFDYCEGYKAFMSKCKTERECVYEALRMAKEKGFKDIEEYIATNTHLHPGDKVYANNHDKTVALFTIGKEPVVNGIKILGAHIDSPRIDVKQVPFYESHEMAYLDTHYYGGIKKYQWLTIPLALHGVVIKKDGTEVLVNIGENSTDPVFCISDLLIHLSGELMSKPAGKVVDGEKMDLLVGTIPLDSKEEKELVKANVLKLLKEKYDVEEEDFTSAEIEIVPAGAARDVGFDRSMVLAYGQDDRACGYTSLTAFLEVEDPDRTTCCYLADKEEVGSTGNTGSNSNFFQDMIAEMIYLTNENYSDLLVKRCMRHSIMISSDVSAGFDPLYANAFEIKNSALLSYGICFNKYTGRGGKGGSSDANPEYIAKLRTIFDEDGITYQTGEIGAVDVGGGGTIAGIFAKMNMEVIDSGVPVLNMHAPHEISAKCDIYEAQKAYKTFLTKG